MINLETISIQDNLFQVYRKLKDNEKWDSTLLKKLWNCTHVFRHNGMLYVCREIETINYQQL